MTREEAESILIAKFGLRHFYDDQWEAISRLLAEERILLIQRTGFGKSLVYQFVAHLLPYTTVVFSPLKALMRDQIARLHKAGIPAALITSDLSLQQKRHILLQAAAGAYKMIFISPERLDDVGWQETIHRFKLSMVVIDEAHCISAWGHDFRPAYRRIVSLIRQFPQQFPILACTATATARVQADVTKQINDQSLTVLRGPLTRPNFSLSVRQCATEDEKMIALLDFVMRQTGTGIVYAGTKQSCEWYAQWLEFNGVSAAYYHSGLDDQSRQEIEAGLMGNAYSCVVATNALGMGLDKPDLRFVAHIQVPTSPMHYYQEIGRAGRDGGPASVCLFYCKEDDQLANFFISGGRPELNHYQVVIEAVKQTPLSLKELKRKVDVKDHFITVVVADLIEQGILAINTSGFHHELEYRVGAPALDTSTFEQLKQAKWEDFQQMKAYIHHNGCRMRFLSNYLGEHVKIPCGSCDNDLGVAQQPQALLPAQIRNLTDFKSSFYPDLDLNDDPGVLLSGVAGSFYGISNVGKAIRRSKYHQGGDFPDFLVDKVMEAYKKRYASIRFDYILFVPPTKSGDLVKNFAARIASKLGIPLHDGLVKTRDTRQQKEFENLHLKEENARGAFRLDADISGKRILLIDDIFDSGHTIRAIAALLKSKGAACIAPLVIAKTVGGR